MIKRTVYFGNPAYVSLRLDQLEIRLPEVEKSDALPEGFKTSAVKRIPIEDIGVVVLDHRQITISQGALSALLDHQAAVITCSEEKEPDKEILELLSQLGAEVYLTSEGTVTCVTDGSSLEFFQDEQAR